MPRNPAGRPATEPHRFGELLGRVMQQHPEADVRLVNSILRIVHDDQTAWAEAAQGAAPEPRPKCLRCGASWVHRDDYAGLGTPHAYESDRPPASGEPSTEAAERFRHALQTTVAEVMPHLAQSLERAFDEVLAEARVTPTSLDVERLGFSDLLDVADAILRHYPPDTIVCSHSVKADRGALTTAAIADLIASCRPSDDDIHSEPKRR